MGFVASQARLMTLINKGNLELEQQFEEGTQYSMYSRWNPQDNIQELQKRILHWLWPVDEKSLDFHWGNVVSLREHSEDWVLQNKEFLEWKTDENSLLLVHGAPASGKTILSATIIERMKEHCHLDANSAVAFHFFRTNPGLLDVQRIFLRDLLRQLASRVTVIPLEVIDRYKQSDHQSELNQEELLSMLHTLIEPLGHVYVIIDGVDECKERDDLLAMVRSVHKWEVQGLHMLVTTREVGDGNELFAMGKVLRMKPHQNILDLQDCLHKRLQIYSHEEGFQSAVKGQSRPAEKSLSDDSNELAVFREGTDSQVSTVMHDRVLMTVNPEARSDIRKILHFLAFAARAVTASEISGMLTIDLTPSVINKPENSNTYLLNLLQLCEPVLQVSQQNQNFKQENRYLAKESFRAYLSSARIIEGPLSDFSITQENGHLKTANICIAYLSQFNNEDAFHSRDIGQFHFARYAAQFWYAHSWASQRYQSGGLSNQLREQRATILNAIRIYDPEWPSAEANLSRLARTIPSLLYYSSLSGLEEYVRVLIGHEDFKDTEGLFQSPLQAAAAGGHNSVVQLLLDSGLDVNAQCGCYGNALCSAASVGNDTIVKTLLYAGADVNLIGANFGKLLYQTRATEWSNQEMVTRASKPFEDVGPIDNAFLMAAYEGHVGVIKILIGAGADVDAKDSKEGRTPLIWATIRNKPQIVELLLVAGADLNLADHRNNSALQIALEHHFDEITESLLRRDVEASGDALDAVFQSSMKINPASYAKDKRLTNRLKGKGAQASAVEVLLRVSDAENGEERILRKCFSLQGESLQRLRRNILRERDVLRTLNHPNVVKFLGYRENKKRQNAYLYMEYCDGGDLTQFISEESPDSVTEQSKTSSNVRNDNVAPYESDASSDPAPSPQQRRTVTHMLAWSMLEQIAAALAYCHHGVVKDGAQYRLTHVWRQADFKTVVLGIENNEEVAKLCDLGLVRVRDDLEKQTRGLGTLDFMPPEVKYEMRPWSTKGDCFSLGATFKGMARDFEDSEWETVIAGCLQPSPQKRPSSLMILQSAQEALARLRGIQLVSSLFVSSQTAGNNHLQRATFELLGRFFRTFKRIKVKEKRRLAARIQWLQEDTRDIDRYEWTYLDSVFLAVLLQNREELGVLLAQPPIDPSAKCSWDTRGLTPLHISAQNGASEICDLLLKQYQNQTFSVDWLNPATQDQDGETAAHLAAAHGSPQTLRALLEISRDLINAEDKIGQTPLHRAAANGHLLAVEVLVEAGADISRRSAVGLTAEAMTSNGKYTEITKYLQAAKWEGMNKRINALQEADKDLEVLLERLAVQKEAVQTEVGSVQDIIARNIEASFRMMG